MKSGSYPRPLAGEGGPQGRVRALPGSAKTIAGSCTRSNACREECTGRELREPSLEIGPSRGVAREVTACAVTISPLRWVASGVMPPCILAAEREEKTTTRQYGIGTDDFRQLRTQRVPYVDKSLILKEIIESQSNVLLLPRPRRFGKTVNMSMLRYFFEKPGEDRTALFQDLAIWRQGPEILEHYQRYPVIFVTLKDITGSTRPELHAALRSRIGELFLEAIRKARCRAKNWGEFRLPTA